MTNMIINQNVELRREYLLSQINHHLQRDFTSIAQLHRIPDIHIVEMTEKSSIGIEDIKQLQKEMIFQPFEEIYQVGIIFYADALTIEAQNALLKTLEEVGERSLYFLLCSNDKNLLDTIGSRSIKHYVKENPKFKTPKIQEITTPQILSGDLVEKFQYIDELVTQDKEEVGTISEFFTELSTFMHNIFNEMINDDKNTEDIREFIKKIDLANYRIKRNVNKQLSLENLILDLPEELAN